MGTIEETVEPLVRGLGDPGSYRSFFSFPPQDGVKARVLEQVRVWLGEKGWDPELEKTGFVQQSDDELFVLHHQTRNLSLTRVRLRENSALGEWRTELTLSDPRSGDGWISLTVTNSEGRFVAVPRLAGYLLDVVNGFDGPASLNSEPVLLSPQGLEGLLEELCSEEREALLFVAGTADDSELFPVFRRRVRTWTNQVRGLGRVVVLDPHTTLELAAALGRSHAVQPWTVRTFQPVVDPAVELDGRRHRILGVASLAQRRDRDLAQLLGNAARAHAATRKLPDAVLSATRTLVRLEAQVAVSALTSNSPLPDGLVGSDDSEPAAETAIAVNRDIALVPATGDQGSPTEAGADVGLALHEQAAAYLAQIELVRSVLGVGELDESTLRDLAERARQGTQVESAVARVGRKLEDQQARIESLEDEVAFYREYAEEEEFGGALAEEERARLDDQVRWLRGRLSELEAFDLAFAEVPESAYTRYPRSFEELLTRVSELEPHGVVFCADRRKASALDDHDSLDKLVRAAWDALLVLCDYLKARRAGICDSGLDGYLGNPPNGHRTVPPKKFASTETSKTMNDHGAERRLPVPIEVDVSQTATMKAHFKLGRVGRVSPRLYLLDRFATHGKVYVGYLGAHLTNAHTN